MAVGCRITGDLMPDTRFGGSIIPAGMFTPTPQRQAAFVGAALGIGAVRPTAATGVYALQRLKTAATVHRQIVGPVSAFMSAYSTVESAYYIHRGGYKPAFTVKYEPYDPLWVPPFPVFGDIPIIRPRLDVGAERTESRGGEDSMLASRTGTPVARKTMRGPSASKRSKKPKFVRYRTGGCPPGYTYDPKRKMCIHNSYR